jgi:carbonic anhydrase
MTLAHILDSSGLLWISCSDCPLPVDLVEQTSGNVLLLHQTIANLVLPGDVNSMSVLQYAVDIRKMKQIVVCGHYGCHPVKLALRDAGNDLVGHWLEPVRQLAQQWQELLAALPDETSRVSFLCEENVRAQVASVENSSVVRRAREAGQVIRVYGWIYDAQDKTLRDLMRGQ